MPINWGILNPNLPALTADSYAEGQQNAILRAAAKQDSELKAYGLQKAKRDDAAQNALLGALQSAQTPDEVQQAYIRAGKGKEAYEMQKSRADAGLTDAKAANYKIDLAGQAAGYVRNNPTLENAHSVLDYLGANKVFTPEQVAQYKAQTAQNPGQIKQMADMLYQSALSAKDQLAKIQTNNLGGKSDTIAIDPLTNKVTPIMSQAHTATPGELMTDARSRASLAQSERHHQDSMAQTSAQTRATLPSYRWKADGTQEVIPGSAADTKTQALTAQKTAGATDVDLAIGTLRDAYDRLQKGGGITSTKNGALSNIAASSSSSGIGQTVGKMLGTDNQSARNDIAMTRPALLAALMKATGMSAKQMDSNAELKLWLATATDPTLDVESNRRALDKIEQKYIGKTSAPVEPSHPSGGGYQDPAKEQRYQEWLKAQGR